MAQQLHAPDYVIFAATLLVSAAIGIYYTCVGGKQKTTAEFLLADRNMGVIPVAVSILLSFMSAILILRTPAEMYTEGIEFYLRVLTGFGVVIAAQLFVPLLFPLKITSAFEYLEKRFNSRAAILTSTCLMILQQVTYRPLHRKQGGMKAVVWTDVLESVVMLAGLLAIVIEGSNALDGMDNVWSINDEWRRIKISAMLTFLGIFILMMVVCLAGITTFAYYAKKGCDPLSTNLLIPYFVMDVLGFPELPGLLISSLFSGAQSSMSSCLNALSAVCWEDFLKPVLQDRLTEGQRTLKQKQQFKVLLFGAAGIRMSFVATKLGGTALQTGIFHSR